MELQVYSIYDTKTKSFSPPMVFHNDAHCLRQLRMDLPRAKDISQFPADFEVRHVGTWDDAQGIMAGELPRSVIRCDSLFDSTESNHQGETPSPA